jgi:hypothetical protein
MWPFRKKPTASAPVTSRYKDNPINIFFEDLILDVLGQLPAERSSVVQALNLQKVFSTQESEWKAVIRETLHLSETFDIAVLDLWIRNREHYAETAEGYRAFAQNFADMYMVDDSRVDVWPDGALSAAKDRIRKFKIGSE